MKKYIIFGGIAAIIAVFGIWKYTFRPADKNVSSHKADVVISAGELVNKFVENEDSANAQFLGKVVEVSGIVDAVTQKDQEIVVYLKDAGEMSGVLCSFDKDSKNIEVVKTGDNLKVKGLCSGYLMDVIMNKCSVE